MKDEERKANKYHVGIYWISGIIVLLLAFLVTYGVMLRLLGAPLPYVEQLSGYSLVFVAFLGLIPTIRGRSQIIIDLVTEKLSPPTQAKLLLLTDFLSCAFVAVFARYSWQWWLVSLRDKTEAIYYFQIPLYLPQFIIPFSMSLVFLEYLILLRQDAREISRQKERS